MRLSVVKTLLCGGAVILIAGFASAVHAARAYTPASAGAHDEGHMSMTALRPAQPGDKERADAIVAAARKFAEKYKDAAKAQADGYEIFMPDMPQHVYHFTNNALAVGNAIHFDPARPTSLLYEKTAPAKPGAAPGWKLVGVMYTAPFRASESALDQRVPLSVAQWHLHTNLCLPPAGSESDLKAPDPKFGLEGSIVTSEDCKAAGGRFMPHLFGWMVHVYPFETDPARVWAAGMDDDHNMGHDAMPGMKMAPGEKM